MGDARLRSTEGRISGFRSIIASVGDGHRSDAHDSPHVAASCESTCFAFDHSTRVTRLHADRQGCPSYRIGCLGDYDTRRTAAPTAHANDFKNAMIRRLGKRNLVAHILLLKTDSCSATLFANSPP